MILGVTALSKLSTQWGFVSDNSNYSHVVNFSFNIAFAVTPYIVLPIQIFNKEHSSTFFNINPITITNTKAILWYGGYGDGNSNTKGYYWLACGI